MEDYPKMEEEKEVLRPFSKITLSDRVPNYVVIKSAATSERDFLADMDMPKGTINVFDKGFHKYEQYDKWTQAGVFYLTRANDNIKFRIVGQHELTQISEFDVQKDCQVELNYHNDRKEKCTTTSRLVAYIDPESDKKLVFLTNLPEKVSAETVCLL